MTQKLSRFEVVLDFGQRTLGLTFRATLEDGSESNDLDTMNKALSALRAVLERVPDRIEDSPLITDYRIR